MNSDRHLRQTIDGLRKLERKCFAARNRFAFYGYLAAVFELYLQLRRRNQAKPWARRIAELFGLRKQNRTHPIRTIIDATSTTDIKTRSRWSRALRYAWRERKSWTDLASFLRENGGPAGCADQFAAINQRGRYPGCIVYRRPGNGRPYLLDHEDIAQRFKFESRLRIGPRAPKALLRLFKPIVWSRTIELAYHELMPEALPVP